MYEFIKGKNTELNPSFIVVENTGMGYLIQISLTSYRDFLGHENVMVYLHLVIREDAHQLFGFSTRRERDLFRHLILVSGIGPNTARTMLSASSPDEIQTAIRRENVTFLKSIKGIGIKTAQKIVIDLRDKVDKAEMYAETGMPKGSMIKEEAASALVMLGFGKPQVEKVIDSILKLKPEMPVEDLIKAALKSL